MMRTFLHTVTQRHGNHAKCRGAYNGTKLAKAINMQRPAVLIVVLVVSFAGACTVHHHHEGTGPLPTAQPDGYSNAAPGAQPSYSAQPQDSYSAQPQNPYRSYPEPPRYAPSASVNDCDCDCNNTESDRESSSYRSERQVKRSVYRDPVLWLE